MAILPDWAHFAQCSGRVPLGRSATNAATPTLEQTDQSQWLLRLLTNFLHLPDRLICLSRIDQAEGFA